MLGLFNTFRDPLWSRGSFVFASDAAFSLCTAGGATRRADCWLVGIQRVGALAAQRRPALGRHCPSALSRGGSLGWAAWICGCRRVAVLPVGLMLAAAISASSLYAPYTILGYHLSCTHTLYRELNNSAGVPDNNKTS